MTWISSRFPVIHPVQTRFKGAAIAIDLAKPHTAPQVDVVEDSVADRLARAVFQKAYQGFDPKTIGYYYVGYDNPMERVYAHWEDRFPRRIRVPDKAALNRETAERAARYMKLYRALTHKEGPKLSLEAFLKETGLEARFFNDIGQDTPRQFGEVKANRLHPEKAKYSLYYFMKIASRMLDAELQAKYGKLPPDPKPPGIRLQPPPFGIPDPVND